MVKFMLSEPFYSSLSRNVRKVPTLNLPTAGVTVVDDEIVMFYNPIFFAELTSAEVRGVIKHEFHHLMFMHCTSRKRTPHVWWNIATDLAINWLITGYDDKDCELPEGCLYPGKSLKVQKKHVSKEQKTVGAPEGTLSQLIASFPGNKTSEWYFEEIKKAADKFEEQNGSGQSGGEEDGKGQPGQGGFNDIGSGTLDDHDLWDELTNEQREFAEAKCREMMRKAVDRADASNGWGSVPSSIRGDLRKLTSNEVDWKSLLRRFAGRSQACQRTNSIKKINRKYPYIHPGRKRKHTARLAIAIDQSGSVGNEELELLFAELSGLARTATFTVVPFDYSVDEKNVFVWKRGQKLNAKRTRSGGTCFKAPTKWVNDRADKFDGLIILTDGQAEKPGRCRIKRAWVCVPDTNLYFESDETVILMKRPASAA
jgi:predicted metal-dependent peptidase